MTGSRIPCLLIPRVRRLLLLTAVLVLGALELGPKKCEGLSIRSISSEGPPVRPNTFNSVEDLNKYLSALTEYYTVLGRPRFGKRGGVERFSGSTRARPLDDDDDDEYTQDEFDLDSDLYPSRQWKGGLSFPYRQLYPQSGAEQGSNPDYSSLRSRWVWKRNPRLHHLKKRTLA